MSTIDIKVYKFVSTHSAKSRAKKFRRAPTAPKTTHGRSWATARARRRERWRAPSPPTARRASAPRSRRRTRASRRWTRTTRASRSAAKRTRREPPRRAPSLETRATPLMFFRRRGTLRGTTLSRVEKKRRRATDRRDAVWVVSSVFGKAGSPSGTRRWRRRRRFWCAAPSPTSWGETSLPTKSSATTTWSDASIREVPSSGHRHFVISHSRLICVTSRSLKSLFLHLARLVLLRASRIPFDESSFTRARACSG